MKRLTLFFALVLGLGLTSLSAQTCSKSASACSKKSVAACHASADAAAKLAAMDDSIESQVDEKTGTVSYVRKETSPEGKVVFTSVEYNSELGKFVNVSPSAVKACAKGGKTGCCASKAKATSADAGVQPTKTSQKGS